MDRIPSGNTKSIWGSIGQIGQPSPGQKPQPSGGGIWGTIGSNIGQLNSGQITPFQKPNPTNTGAGSLYIRDSFTPSFGFSGGIPEVPHGVNVAGAAGQQAGVGAKLTPSVGDEPAAIMNFNPEYRALGTKEMSPEQARAALTGDIEYRSTQFLDNQSDYLERLTASGAENSAANFSLGSSKASESFRVYEMALGALGKGNKTLSDNFIKAYGVDEAKIRSRDDGVQQAELSKLQQSIINHVSDTWDNSDKIGNSVDRWDGAVEKFEKGKNSVVISAGNEGDVEEFMEKVTGKHQLNVPSDFETNILENDLVTSVGATDGKGKRAEYSSESGGVDIYANGNYQAAAGAEPVEGTSFASPRVGVVMAELHKLNPDMTSAQVETLMRNKLSQPLAQGNSAAPVLRSDASLSFLRGQKY